MLDHDIVNEEWNRYDHGGVLAFIKSEPTYRGVDHAATIWGPGGFTAGMLFDARKFGKITPRHVEIAALARSAPELARTVKALLAWGDENAASDHPAWEAARAVAAALDDDLSRARSFGQSVGVAAE